MLLNTQFAMLDLCLLLHLHPYPTVHLCACRLAAVKKAADASGRRICFVGMSLTTYLEAAHAEGQAPFSPADLVPVSEIEQHDPNSLLLVTTGSQVKL